MTAFDSLQPESIADQQRLRIGELILFAFGLAILMAAEILVNNPKLIFDGPFVLDERLTDLIVRDPSISHSIDAVRHGVDTNPPVFHLIDRAFWTLVHPMFHDSPRITLRVFSIVCTWMALVGLYVLLRRAFFPLAAMMGVLVVWAHPDVIEQSATARFYAPLLFATIAVCLSIQISGIGIARGIVVALAAVLLCTLHYFGIAVLAPIVLATMLVDATPLKQRMIRALPTLAGPLALLSFLSFVRSQHEGLSVKTWIDPVSFHLARDFLQQVLCPLPLAIAVIIWAISRAIRRDVPVFSPVSSPASSPVSSPIAPIALRGFGILIAPLLSLIAVPVVIVLFSVFVQSALLSRYAIAGTLVLAPLVAMLSQNLPRRSMVFMAILLSGFTLLELHGIASRHASAARTLVDRRDALEHEQPPLPIVFADRSDAMELLAFAPGLLSRMSIVDQRAPSVTLRDYRRYELDMGEKVRPFYPMPPLITPQQMGPMGPLHLVAQADDWQNLLLEQPMKRVGETDVYQSVK